MNFIGSRWVREQPEKEPELQQYVPQLQNNTIPPASPAGKDGKNGCFMEQLGNVPVIVPDHKTKKFGNSPEKASSNSNFHKIILCV